MKFPIFCSLSFVIGFLFGYISAGRIYFDKFLNLSNILLLAIVDRIDRMLLGNDGAYSHTRVINIVWGIGGFCLICITTLRKIDIPSPILVLMGSGMGISGLQAVTNKINELKFATNQSKEPVAEGNKDDKSN